MAVGVCGSPSPWPDDSFEPIASFVRLQQHRHMSCSWNYQIDRLTSKIARNAEALERPFIVAIDGKSGSGKSTLADFMAQKLDCSVISGDDFFSGGETVSRLPPENLAQICIDWKSQRRVLESLRRSEPARFFPYDWDAFDGSKRSTPMCVGVSRVAIFEGVYSARPELRDLVDLRVLIEIPEDERHQRLLRREGQIGEWEMQWHRAEDWYFETAAPRSAFEVVLSETMPFSL